MTNLEIVKYWRMGHSKKWLIEKEYNSLVYQLKRNGGQYKNNDLKVVAQQRIEKVLLNWWKEQLKDECGQDIRRIIV